ncbi:PIN2/TERF1-interacting telomerase inhibitor 1 isoform X1 [Drosophila subobscura]|uniref:PIN2/TERF1-interacting telomerase inhibitor 1 isoform X1 n=1 Tax=Drosophila subobscura TaxID=7241 RepID=UPI00155AF0B2|nr:PIN2/TERF1-interacting telomerase inhibitor 1 isoform X1 [Drosophila subobscura]
MAMLAEPRRRKRYNLCPRGKALYEDDARFGTKMLEKMGWSKGKGLGANEDGQQEFVRVRLKNDAEGLGFEARDDQWTVHEEGFNGLLKSLNGGADETNGANGAASASEDEVRPMFGFKAAEPEEPPKKKLKEKISGISLEEASKASKARVHYKKFTRGKDLSQYSEKDLANIFGKKATEDIPAPVQIEQPQVEEKEINPNFSGVTTVATGLSVHDYFKQKMEAMKNRLKNGSASTPTQSEEVQTENDQNEPAKKKKKKDKERTVEVPAEAEEIVETKQKKKKKSKRSSDQEDESSEKTEEEKPVDELSLDETAPKKKKKSKEVVETIAPEPIPEVENEISKKKKKSKEGKKVVETKEDVEPEEAPAVPQEAENTSLSKSKKKKRSKETVESLTEPVETTPEDTNESLEEAPLKKKKKSKKVKEVDEDIELESEITGKSSKKKNKSNRDVTEDPAPAADTGRKHKDAVSAELNSSGDKSDQSADEDQPEELLSLDEIKEKLKLFNICTISQFCADKFQMFDMNAFRESTLAEITGYGSSANMDLRVEDMKNDDKRIMDLWKNESYASFKKSDRFKNLKYPRQVKRTTLRAVKKRFAFQAI